MNQDHVLTPRMISNGTRTSFSMLFILVLSIGILYAGSELLKDLANVRLTSTWPYVLLGVALLIALGFEFVNGFHDTANAVATVIYTNSLKPYPAVIWSGVWNLIGVLVSTGAVAFGIIALLPVELILQVGSRAGFAMVFALLFAAIIWNLGTWYLGLPSSSSHTLIGSIVGVGLMNQILQGDANTSGVDWSQTAKVGYSLLLSPLIGFGCAALLLLVAKIILTNPSLYQTPKNDEPPPLWIRGLLILTCTGVSFAHGSNDGQKGMGLIMLILIGTVPTAYALNRAMPPSLTESFVTISRDASQVLGKHVDGTESKTLNPRQEVGQFLKTRRPSQTTMGSLSMLTEEISQEVSRYGSYAKMPDDLVGNIRNDMYMVSESLRHLAKLSTPAFSVQEKDVLKRYKSELDHATKYIPAWVKVAVAIALGLGTMVGWKRIVVTVGERIGKTHLTYAQGASAESVAMATISAADAFGLPVSTTQVLSSGVAGTMAANRSGLQWSTVRNILMAWVLTLPMSIALAGGLYWFFRLML